MKTARLRIATYNLHKCVGLDLRRRPDRVLSVLAAADPAIAVLQEADRRIPGRPAALPHDMAEAAGWHIVDPGTHSRSLGWHGNAVLVRPGIRVITAEAIELPGLEPRGAILAEFETPLGRLRVLGMHLGLLRRYRLQQLTAVRHVLDDRSDCPTVLAGDLNEWGTGHAMQSRLGPYRLLPAVPSFPAPRPVAPLDRFALGPGLAADPPRAHVGAPAHVASDHLPVCATLRLA